MSFSSVLLSVVLAHTLVAQIPGVTSSPSAAPQQEQPADPLGRTTPRGTISAFIRAVERNDMVGAAQYMQVTESQRRNTETLARNLKDLMDRYFSEPITSISDSPDGALDDGVPIDRERVGPLTIGQSKTDITLVRVTDPQAGRVWLISSETLAQIPALRRSIARTWIERVMPTTLMSRELLGISLAHWIVLVASLPFPSACSLLFRPHSSSLPDGSSEIPHGAAMCASGMPSRGGLGSSRWRWSFSCRRYAFWHSRCRSASPTRTSGSSCWSSR